MSWIELHDTVRNNKKTYKLMEILSISKPQAVGTLCLLWTWALEAAEDGDLTEFSPRAIADACEWKKSPTNLLDALIESRWLDRCDGRVLIHDWYEYAGRLIERREEERAYKKRKYALYSNMRLTKEIRARDGNRCRYCGKEVNWNDKKGLSGGTYDHVDPNGDNSLENIVVACRSCTLKKKDSTLSESSMKLLPSPADIMQIYCKYQANNGQIKSAITVPNRTIPYLLDDDDIQQQEDDARARIQTAFKTSFGNEPTPAELDALAEWLDRGMDVGVVCEAVRRSAEANADNRLAYAMGCLLNWRVSGCSTLEDVQMADADRDVMVGRV